MSEETRAVSLGDLQRMQEAERQQRARRCLEKIRAALAEERCRIEAVVQPHATADGFVVVVRGAGWLVVPNE